MDVRNESTNWLCRDYSAQSERIERLSKELAEASEKAKKIRAEIERRMDKAGVCCLVGPDGMAFIACDHDDFAPSFETVRSCSPWDVDKLLAAVPAGDPAPPESEDNAVVEAVRAWGAAS